MAEVTKRVCQAAKVSKPVEKAVSLAIPVTFVTAHIKLPAKKFVKLGVVVPGARRRPILVISEVSILLLLLADLEKVYLIFNRVLSDVGLDVRGYILIRLQEIEL